MKNRSVFFVLCLLLGLADVDSQLQTFPYVYFMGQTLANHSYVDLSLVGNDGSSSVQCHTDLGTCCSVAQGPHRGDWYFPDGTRLQLSADIYETRTAQRVELRHNTGVSPTGVYRCDIPTNAVHHYPDTSVKDTVYVGLYTADGGIYIVKLPDCPKYITSH